MALIPDDPKQRKALLVVIFVAALTFVFHSYWYTPKQTELEEMRAQLEWLEQNNRLAQILVDKGVEVIVGAPSIDPESVVRSYLAGAIGAGANACDH